MLLNQTQAGSAAPPAFGEQYVPPDYRAVQLSGHLQLFKQKLFGVSPDRDFMNYRLHQFTQLLHASELAEYMMYHDARITYLATPTPELLTNSSYLPQVHYVTSSGEFDQLQIYGSGAPPDHSGRMLFQYRIELSSGGKIFIDDNYNSIQIVDSPDFASGLSKEFDLPETGYKFRIPAQDRGIWIITVRNRPQYDLGQLVLLLEGLGETNYLKLFGVNPVEPYLTFKNLWESEEALPYRLGAFLLAIAFRSGEESNSMRQASGIGEMEDTLEMINRGTTPVMPSSPPPDFVPRTTIVPNTFTPPTFETS